MMEDVLDKIYGVSRTVRGEALWRFLNVRGVEADEAVRNAVKVYRDVNLDLVDIFLAVKSQLKGTKVLTWERGLKKTRC